MWEFPLCFPYIANFWPVVYVKKWAQAYHYIFLDRARRVGFASFCVSILIFLFCAAAHGFWFRSVRGKGDWWGALLCTAWSLAKTFFRGWGVWYLLTGLQKALWELFICNIIWAKMFFFLFQSLKLAIEFPLGLWQCGICFPQMPIFHRKSFYFCLQVLVIILQVPSTTIYVFSNVEALSHGMTESALLVLQAGKEPCYL